jgi:hypothetical protein
MTAIRFLEDVLHPNSCLYIKMIPSKGRKSHKQSFKTSIYKPAKKLKTPFHEVITFIFENNDWTKHQEDQGGICHLNI